MNKSPKIKLSNSSLEQISTFASDYVETTVFTKYPNLKNETTVVITGSVAKKQWDDSSDIDINFIFPKETLSRLGNELKEYKKGLSDNYPQIQSFFKDTYEDLETLLDWEDDLRLGEFSVAIILHDPKNWFKEFQSKISWYPEEILREKINWLFAETVFELEDRLKVAIKRKNEYFLEVVKLRLIRLIANTFLLLANNYPPGDKQLWKIFQNHDNVPVEIKKILEKSLNEQNENEILKLLEEAKKLTESMLISKNLITKNPIDYWIKLRPKYQVKI